MFYLSLKKKNELKKELDYLLDEFSFKIAKKIEEYREVTGKIDSDDLQYQAIISEKEKMEKRARHLEDVLKNHIIVKNKKHIEVEIGSTVVIRKNHSKIEKIFKVVGREELDLNSKKISIDSPLVRVMLEKKKGDKFVYITPSKKENKYLIVDIY